MRFRELHTALLVVLLSGCPTDPPADDEGSDSSDPEPVPLATFDRWERVTDASVDAFADQRPAEAVCDDSGWIGDPITQTLEVQTEVCDYLTVRQPTLEPLEPGDVVTVYAFHDVLTATEPAQGYLGLALEGEVVWELNVPIPSEAASIEQQFTIESSLPEGADLQFHVHNHGPNSWELLALMVTPAS